MKKSIPILLSLLAIAVLTGCPPTLTSSFDDDLVLALGRFAAGEGTTDVRGAVGGTLDVPVRITNQSGGGASGSYDVTFTLSSDGDLATEGDNTALGTVAVSAGGETVASVTVPATVGAATYTLFGAMAASDSVQNNNTSSVPVEIGAVNSPDLELAFGTTPSAAEAGSSLEVWYRISNNGYATIASGTSFVVRVTVNLSAVDEEVGETTVTLSEDLHPHESITAETAVTIPTTAQMAADLGVAEDALGVWSDTFTATVDADDAVVEIVEGGTDTFAITSGARRADLVAEDIILPNDFAGAAKIGGLAELAVEIRNEGVVATDAYAVDLYVDINANGAYDDGTDAVIHRWAEDDTPVVPYDLGGDNNVVYLSTVSEGAVYPATITEGTYDVRAEITVSVDEYDTANNDVTEASVDFVDEIVDLSMRYMSTTLAAAIDEGTGGTIPLSYVLENDGEDAVSTDFDVAFYASDDGILDTAGDILLGTDTVTAEVPAGGTVQESYSATFPASHGTAFYTVYWVIDSGDAVVETDEGDNTPADVNSCYVFPVVSDGVTDITTKLLVYKPANAATTNTRVTIRLYSALWSSYISGSGYALEPSDLYASASRTLTPGAVAGITIYPGASRDVSVVFTLVPSYVSSLPANAIPSGVISQDRFEPNNDEDDAYALPASQNPFFGFVSVWVDPIEDRYDYFTFDVP